MFLSKVPKVTSYVFIARVSYNPGKEVVVTVLRLILSKVHVTLMGYFVLATRTGLN